MFDALPLVDWIIVGIIALSAGISLIRGFVREALSLATLVAAVVVARVFGGQAATLFADYIGEPSLRLLAAYAVLFILTMIVGGLVNHLIGHLVEVSGLSGTDRLLGALFGVARGLLIVVVAVAILARMPVTQDSWWQESRFIPSFVDAANRIQAMIFPPRSPGEVQPDTEQPT